MHWPLFFPYYPPLHHATLCLAILAISAVAPPPFSGAKRPAVWPFCGIQVRLLGGGDSGGAGVVESPFAHRPSPTIKPYSRARFSGRNSSKASAEETPFRFTGTSYPHPRGPFRRQLPFFLSPTQDDLD